jgi:serine protease DegQ
VLTAATLIAGILAGYVLHAAVNRPEPKPAPPLPAPTLEIPAAQAEAHASYREGVKRALPAVVNVYTSKSLPGRPRYRLDPNGWRFFVEPGGAAPERVTSLGSGVVVDADGTVLTNNHVVEGADEVAAAFSDGKTARARVIATDPDTDLALLKVERKSLTPITFADSDQVQVGDLVLAIGNPFGVGQTVTHGIVSAVGRKSLGINPLENFIQTDAPINPGNSGGALVDSHGRLVGVNTAIFSESGGSQGIGFAIPVNLARQVSAELQSTGRVERGWIGVEVADLTPELAASLQVPQGAGPLIAGTLKGGPADAAGLKPGDVLTQINGTPITDASALVTQVLSLKPGEVARFTVLRKGKQTEIAVNVATRPVNLARSRGRN